MSQQPNADFTKITEKASWKVFVRYIYILARHLTSRLLYLLFIVYGDIKVPSMYFVTYIQHHHQSDTATQLRAADGRDTAQY